PGPHVDGGARPELAGHLRQRLGQAVVGQRARHDGRGHGLPHLGAVGDVAAAVDGDRRDVVEGDGVGGRFVGRRGAGREAGDGERGDRDGGQRAGRRERTGGAVRGGVVSA